MNITKAEFVTSSADYLHCPEPNFTELAFIGRSNVGKSSLINMLTNHKKLAKVSGRPGKTQLINHFLINDKWYLVDLPGYGWAKVAKTEKAKWGTMIHDYLVNRTNLICTFVLIDSRLPPQTIDVEFINWLGEQGLPFTLIFTKADKQSKNKTQSAVAKYKKFLLNYWEKLPDILVTSSADTTGKEDVLAYIDNIVVKEGEKK